ncbi:uncharacterized protein Z520_07326 [Fonsecaea multimorphosa CBS 102226]|uniref:GET complex, subunit GET2 n=1 Tax=Fonsecaea multimorphosa CBS 102226 TaxID=1442371 RepID=A0A0D2IJH4_9EURO|nr:uncharacterized protein Z520_07326 [Fonsecaea multimorphosa CBS 102226]KIX97211.1 hypothetical protein Z520_07326 [Fonsecaea multimorphosa CBS 102226]OAL22984.1 hypothetical protein AYO22_06892 [Fonsecaea multimorphosa]
MAEPEETPAQRQARIRRQKREAKITGSATERLDKITRLSGRTPESMRNESPVPTPSPRSPPEQVAPPPGGPGALPTPEELRAQEEYLKAMLRQPLSQEEPSQAQQEDPMLKLLQSMMGGMEGSTDPNAPGGMGAGPGLSPDDISKATGLPPFLTNMMMGGQKAPPSQAEIQATRFWKVVHVIFAIMAGLYLVFSIHQATQTYGENPPAPATFQNPFIVFMSGELLVQGARAVSRGQSGKSGVRLWIQMGKEFIGDGAIMVFMLGLASWMKGS